MRSDMSEPSEDEVRRALAALGQTERPTVAERERINRAMLLALDSPSTDSPRVEAAGAAASEANLIEFPSVASPEGPPLLWLRAAAIAVVVGIALALFTQLERNTPGLVTVETTEDDLSVAVGTDRFVINNGSELRVIERRAQSVVLAGSDPMLADQSEGIFIVGRVDDLFAGEPADDFFAANGIEATPRILRGGERFGRGWQLTLANRPDSEACGPGTWCVPIGTVDGDIIAVKWGTSLSLDVYDDPAGGSPIVVAAGDPFRVRAAGPLLDLDFSSD